MAEEQKLQEPGCHRLCANNCGFFGSATTLNLCSKCYKDYCIKEQQLSEAKLAVEKSLSPPLSGSCTSVPGPSVVSPGEIAAIVLPEALMAEVEAPAVEAAKPRRCGTCRKRVGLTGFMCRCGITFCGGHRYPETHGCSFDFKAVGREAIARENPVIKADKLHKI